jgi:glycerophosphoryl diester phosphodiesterase
MLGFEMAFAEGAGGIEADVRRTHDGIFVLCHDPILDRTTNGHGVIAELTWPEVATLEAASKHRFGQTFAGRTDCRLPSLGMLLDRFARRPVIIVLHLKGLAVPDLDALLNEVDRRGMTGQCHFFGPLSAINHIKRCSPTCFTLNDGMPGPGEYERALNEAVKGGHDCVSIDACCSEAEVESMADSIHAAGKLVHGSYLSGDYERSTQCLIDAGADFILGNDVGAMLAVLRGNRPGQATPGAGPPRSGAKGA